MGLFENRYVVNFRNGRKKRMTAQQVLNLVRSDSKSDYDWFAASDELVRICKLANFPQDVAILIEAAILNCFANIERTGKMYPDDIQNVVFCYNSLIGIDDYNDLRCKYILSVLHNVIEYGLNDEPRFLHFGSTYIDMCNSWKDSRCFVFVSSGREIINYDQLYKEFNSDFERIIAVEEKKGTFAADEKQIVDNISSSAVWVKKLSETSDYYPDPDQIR